MGTNEVQAKNNICGHETLSSHMRLRILQWKVNTISSIFYYSICKKLQAKIIVSHLNTIFNVQSTSEDSVIICNVLGYIFLQCPLFVIYGQI